MKVTYVSYLDSQKLDVSPLFLATDFPAFDIGSDGASLERERSKRRIREMVHLAL